MTSCRSLILRDNPLTHARPGNRTIEALELDGYLYIPGFLNTHEVAELRAAAECIEPVAENLDADMTEERDGYLNKCINNAFNRDPLFVKYHANGGAAAPARATPRQRRLLGEHAQSNYD